jgi:phosphatidylinositol-3-phosphatase
MAAAAALPVAVLLGLAAPAHAGGQTAATTPAFGHVFLLVGENKDLSAFTASDAPYIINTLKPEGAWFTDYNAVASGSLSDYIALTSGQYAACQTRGPCGSFTVPNLFAQLGSGNWTDWNESMPSNCYAKDAGSLAGENAYQAGHNPALSYTGLPCSTYDVPAGTTGPDDMSAFNNALATGSVPEFNFVTPNNCEDGHNDCNGPHTTAQEATQWNNFLQKEIPLIEASPAFGSNGVIFATDDEGMESVHDLHTMMAVIGPQVQPGTFSNFYDHYSTLATIEQGLGLPCLAGACTSAILPAFGGTPAPSPSVAITSPTPAATASGTLTVSGTAGETGGTISQVQVSVDGGTPVTATGTNSWSASIDTTQLSNGSHTIMATATDTSGLTATTEEPITASNSAATPSVSIGQPAAGSTVSGTVPVSGTASETGGTISQVQVSVDGGTPVTATGTSSWSTSIDSTALSNGPHTITATATDANGHSSSASETVTVNNTVTTSCPSPPSGDTELSGNVSVESAQTGWTGTYNSNSVVTRVQPTGGSYDGTWALQVTPKAAGAGGLSNKPVWVASTTAGQSYEGSVFARASAAGQKLILVLREENASGASVGSHTTTLTAGDTSWHQITTSYTALDSGDTLHYFVYDSNFASTSQHFQADCLSLWTPS